MALHRVFTIGLFYSLALFALAVGLCTPAGASVGFQLPSPEELKMTSEPQAPGAAAIVLFRQVDRDDSGTSGREDSYFRIKILTEEGRKYADIEISFFKGSGSKISGINARTIQPDGSITNFDGRVFEKSIVKAKGVKYMAESFTLPEVQVGSIIEYFYTVQMSKHLVFDSHWILNHELFTKSAKFSLKPYVTPYSLVGCRYTWNYLPPGTALPRQDPDHTVHLEVSNVPAFQTEDFMPPENEVKSHVDFIYNADAMYRNEIENDVTTFWKKASTRMNDELESFLGKRKAMEQAVAQIVSPTDPPLQKLQKIYARVQQLRNISYEIRKTKQEEKRQKYKDTSTVEDVWKRGYGRGGEITWLYLALVQAAGFDAYGVWVSDRRNYFFHPDFMDPSKLDENIVMVKLDAKIYFLDPGAAFTPFGLLPWVETGVMGRKLDNEGGSWIETTLPESSESQIARKAELKLSQDTGDLDGKLAVTYTGLEALQRRGEKRNEDQTARKVFLENEVKEFIPAAAEVKLTNTPDWNSSSASLRAEFEIKVPGWTSGAGRRAMFPVGIFSGTEKRVFVHASRVHPIYVEYPSQRIDDVTVELPPGWQVSSLPVTKDIPGHVVGYTMKAENDKGKLHLSRILRLDFLLLDTKYYPALRTFFQTVRTGDEQQIVLQPVSAAASR